MAGRTPATGAAGLVVQLAGAIEADAGSSDAGDNEGTEDHRPGKSPINSSTLPLMLATAEAAASAATLAAADAVSAA